MPIEKNPGDRINSAWTGCELDASNWLAGWVEAKEQDEKSKAVKAHANP